MNNTAVAGELYPLLNYFNQKSSEFKSFGITILRML